MANKGGSDFNPNQIIPTTPPAGSLYERIQYIFDKAISGQTANSIADMVNTLVSRLTSARAGYLDSLRYPLNFESTSRPNPTSSGTQNTLGSYVQVVASLAHSCIRLHVQVAPNAANSDALRLDLAIGGAGSEVAKYQLWVNVDQTAPCVHVFDVDPAVFVKGSRLSVACMNISSANARTLLVAVTCAELND